MIFIYTTTLFWHYIQIYLRLSSKTRILLHDYYTNPTRLLHDFREKRRIKVCVSLENAHFLGGDGCTKKAFLLHNKESTT